MYTEVTQCAYTKPLRYNGTVAVNVQDIWNYASSTCSTTVQTISSSTQATTTAYNGLNYQEALFIGGIIIFFLSFIAWGRLSFTNIQRKI